MVDDKKSADDKLTGELEHAIEFGGESLKEGKSAAVPTDYKDDLVGTPRKLGAFPVTDRPVRLD